MLFGNFTMNSLYLELILKGGIPGIDNNGIAPVTLDIEINDDETVVIVKDLNHNVIATKKFKCSNIVRLSGFYTKISYEGG